VTRPDSHRRRLAALGFLAVGLWVAAGCAGPGTPPATPEAPTSPDAPAPADAADPPGADRPVDPRFDAAAEYSAAHAGIAFLVLEGEEVVYQAGSEAPQPLDDATESFWGVLAVAASQDGLLSLDELVSDTLPEFQRSSWKREMRISHLLHFTSGLEAGIRSLYREGATDRFAKALELEALARPGDRFQYGPSHLFVFAELLRRKLEAAGEDPDPLAYLRRRLLDPIGLTDADWSLDWERDGAGNPDPTSGARLSARDWARFGLLLKARGRWQGRKLVDAELLEACFRGSDVNPGFGLALWLNVHPERREGAASWSLRDPTRAFHPGALPDLVAAAGHRNQRLFVIPSLDLVVVRFGERDRSFRDEDLLARIIAGAGEAAPRVPGGSRERTR
jgi:CubicO group peptidase (beta-lactamase class C family)